MAKIKVPRNQQLAMAAAHPKPVYSRIVSCRLVVAFGAGAKFRVTHALGDRLWLLGVKVWLVPKPIDPTLSTDFKIITGSLKPGNSSEAYKWENVIPLYGSSDELRLWAAYDGRDYFEWKMMKFYEGRPRMFGIYAIRLGVGTDVLRVSFEVSEG